MNFALRSIAIILLRILQHAVNITAWGWRLYIPSEERRVMGLSPLKTHRPRLGLNQRNLVPMASTLTTRPQRRLHGCHKTVSTTETWVCCRKTWWMGRMWKEMPWSYYDHVFTDTKKTRGKPQPSGQRVETWTRQRKISSTSYATATVHPKLVLWPFYNSVSSAASISTSTGTVQ
jgi:hypothetical protein